MQVTLSASDFAAMPATLREDLLAYLATRRKTPPSGVRRRDRTVANGIFDGLAVLDRDQAVALIRDVSFGCSLKGLHELL